jgi:hypothetical protein
MLDATSVVWGPILTESCNLGIPSRLVGVCCYCCIQSVLKDWLAKGYVFDIIT